MLRTPIRPAVSIPVLRAPAVSALAASVGAAFYVAGRLRRRRRKPIHPDGAVLPGTLHRDGAPTSWGADWLDATGEHEATVRLSRSAGLRAPLPDVLGLAVRVHVDGRPADLLMSSAGRGAVARHVLRPSRRPGRTVYTTLVPYRSSAGSVLMAAEPVEPRDLPQRLDRMTADLTARPLTFRLLCARPRGEWETFGTLEVGGRDGSHARRPDGDLPAERPWPDAAVSYDPVLNPLPGLRLPGVLAGMRARAYADARRARGLPG